MALLHTFVSMNWYQFLDEEAQSQVRLTASLYEREERFHSALSDYSFVVFPMAKAYEGFLKKFLYTMGLISISSYQHRQFRIGRSLNPDVSYVQRDEFWLFDDVEHLCSVTLARNLWETWIEARNHLFHYFPDTRYIISLPQSLALLQRMSVVMDAALSCTMHPTSNAYLKQV